MDRKSILILAFTAFFLIMVAFSVIVFLKLKRPELLGLPPNPIDSTIVVKTPLKSVELEPTYEITAEKLDDFKEKAKERIEFQKRADSLAKVIAELKKKDSVNKAKLNKLNDSIIPNKEQLINNSQTYSDYLQDSISKLYDQTEEYQAKAEIAENEKTQLEKYLENEVDSLEIENFKQFAKIYNSSDPAKVAGILEKMDEKEAAAILKFMRVKNAGKVIEQLPPDKAALILLLANKK